MQRLLNFLYEYRAFFTFLILEVLSAWLLIQNNAYQSTKYFNTSNSVVAGIIGFSQRTREYFALGDVNTELSRENAQLRTALEIVLQQNRNPSGIDTVRRYQYVSAKVINSSVANFKNYITINRGEDAGLQPDMAVVSTFGAVGKVKAVSEHFSVITSLLNIDERVSSVIRRTGSIGTVQWDGTNPRYVNMLYVPRHVQPQPGDTVSTSGYNAIFPDGVLIGVIRDVSLREEAPFYDIKVELSQDFTRLSYLKIIKSRFRRELDSLEQVNVEKP